MPHQRQPRLGEQRVKVAKLSEHLLILTPVLRQLHLELQKHRAAQELLNLMARFQPQLLQRSAPLAHDDADLQVGGTLRTRNPNDRQHPGMAGGDMDQDNYV